MLTAKQIYDQLSEDIIEQSDAKKAISIAYIRRKQRLKIKNQEIKNSIIPANILMIGPTGVGKTEIARKLAIISDAPFYKTDMTRFSEVGYAGKDTDNIIKEFIEDQFQKRKKNLHEKLTLKERKNAIDKVASLIISTKKDDSSFNLSKDQIKIELEETQNWDDFLIELDNNDYSGYDPNVQYFEFHNQLIEIVPIFELGNKINNKKKKKKTSVKNAIKTILEHEISKMIDNHKIIEEVIYDIQENGIIFLDEIDKLITSSNAGSRSGEVSREGVQRDLLSIIEGATINTKYGNISTDKILFIASGAFHAVKPSDLMSELQGRLPIRVELMHLSENDLFNILKTKKTSLITQYSELFLSDNIILNFKEDAIKEIARITFFLNKLIENIGARRLQSVLEIILEELSFNIQNSSKKKQEIIIDSNYIKANTKKIFDKYSVDTNKFIL